jgi:hypothetical protein
MSWKYFRGLRQRGIELAVRSFLSLVGLTWVIHRLMGIGSESSRVYIPVNHIRVSEDKIGKVFWIMDQLIYLMDETQLVKNKNKNKMKGPARRYATELE